MTGPAPCRPEKDGAPVKAALYCRLSKEDEAAAKGGGESESIQNQRSLLIDYALANGFEIYRIYCDEDYSGIDRNRPAFNAMLQAAREHRFQVILAKTQSRFTRDMELVEKYLHGCFAEWGVRFIAVVDHVDTADAANKKSRQIAGLVNEWYLEDLSDNVRSVLSHKRREGKYIATFPLYGYRKDPRDHNHLLVDPQAARVVRRIFSLYRQGYGVVRIAALLNRERVPSPAAYKLQQGCVCRRALQNPHYDLWSKSTIYQMLGNSTYAGNLQQGRHRKVSYKSDKVVCLPRDQWIVVPHTHEAIIPPPLFEEVQRMLRLKARGGGSGRVSPLAGLVVCGLCGSHMEQTGSGPNRYYRCRLSLRDKSRCPGQRYMPAASLVELVQQRVQAHLETLPDPGTLPPAGEEPPPEPAAQLEQRARQCRQALCALYADRCAGLLPEDTFQSLRQTFLQQAASLEAQARQAAQQQAARPEAETPGAFRLGRALACQLIEQVVVYPPAPEDNVREIEIHWRF